MSWLRCAVVAAAVVTLSGVGSAQAATVVVDALGNSSSGGTPAPVFNVTAGEMLHVSVDPGDLWSAGALPRWSNADGLTHNLFATGSDDSGEAANTLIGINFGTWTEGNLTAPYGTLVGDIGGVFEVLGTNFTGAAWGTGPLGLVYWDSNNGDNAQFVTASVVALPEPATWAMMLFGLGSLGLGLRMSRRTNASVAAA